MEQPILGFVYAAIIAIVLWLWFWVPFHMAERRRRRGWLYVGLSIVLTPLIVLPALWVMGGSRRIPRS